MKVTAIVGVKNEVELIGACLAHLHAIGVDHVVVEDCGSTDGTIDVVRAYAAEQLTLKHFDESQNLDAGAWGEHEAELARATGADWVLFLDADEFWLPVTGSIRSLLRNANSDADVLIIDRFNVPLVAGVPCAPMNFIPASYPQIPLYTRRLKDFRAQVTGDTSLPWISGVPKPKIAARPDRILRLMNGHHRAIGLNGMPTPIVKPTGIVIAHLPFTTRQRFMKKVRSMRETHAKQLAYSTGDTAWHWKRWIDLDDAGQIDIEFDRQIISQADLARLQASGAVVTVADLLSQSV